MDKSRVRGGAGWEGVESLDKGVGIEELTEMSISRALETVKFASLRPSFHFNANHYPIQDFFLTEIAKDAKGRAIMAMRGVIAKNHSDAYAKDCKMPAD